ncbi:MAG: hypothetical protein LUD77_05840 [Clostridiales bacterium]|nr:hypothetical protein [Clostridiales bacterium]
MKNLKTYERVLAGDTETPITLFYKYVGDKKALYLKAEATEKSIIHF